VLLQGGMGGGMVGGAPGQHETMGQRVQEHMPGHHNQQASSRASVLCSQYGIPHSMYMRAFPCCLCDGLWHGAAPTTHLHQCTVPNTTARSSTVWYGVECHD
jgi:hypothetical protein